MPERTIQKVKAHPKLNIKKLGPLINTVLEIKPLTLLTGPPGQGKTLLLNALFSELLPADIDLVGACFFRGRWGDKLKIAEALYKEEVIEIMFDKIEVVKEELRIGTMRICISPNKAKRKLEKCLDGWILPRAAKYRYKDPGYRERLLTRISKIIQLTLEKSGFKRINGKLCIDARDIRIGEDSLRQAEKNTLNMIVASLSRLTGRERAYAEWMLAAMLLVSSVSRKVAELRNIRETLDRAEEEVKNAYMVFSKYKPIYAWIGRGLVSLAISEPEIGEIVELTGVIGTGMSAFLPVYSMAKSMREGMRLLGSPEAPKELGLILELLAPAVIGKIERHGERLYLDIKGNAIPFRMAHGGAISSVGLALAAAPLIKEGGGFLLIDEVEHLLHPTAQAMAALALLAITGAGIRVIATTHSTAVTTVIAVMADTAKRKGREATIEKARQLYYVLGYKPPGKNALELVAKGAMKSPEIYLVDSGKITTIKTPLNWVDKLSDIWASLAAWATEDEPNTFG